MDCTLNLFGKYFYFRTQLLKKELDKSCAIGMPLFKFL